MADWSLPTLTDLYTDFRQFISDRLNDAAKMFDSALVAASNLPTGTKRWNSSGSKWEKLSGTTWSDMAAVYNISISGNATTATTAATATNVTTVTSANVIAGLGYTPLSKAGGTVTGALGVSGLITGRAGMTLTGNMYASGAIRATGAAQFDTTLSVGSYASFNGAIYANGQITANNAALRANGWGGIAGDGIIYFGGGTTCIHKQGNVFRFWLDGVFSAEIQKGGTVAMTSDIPAAGVSLDHGANNVGALCLCEDTSNSTLSAGSTISGSNLRPTNAAGSVNGAARTGTWRCLGASISANNVTLYQRIA